MAYFVKPAGTGPNDLTGARLYAGAQPGAVLGGLANGTAYIPYSATAGSMVTPDGIDEVAPDRIEMITTSYGDRPNVVPMRYYEEGQNELVDPLAHPHIMGITHTAIKNGNWSDPTIWNTGTLPGTGAVVSTGTFTVTYDRESDAILKDVLVPMGSTLRWAQGVDTRMRLDYFMAMGIVDIRDQTESATPGKARHEIIFHASVAPGASARLGFMPMGPCRIHGAIKETMLRLGTTGVQTVPAVMAGATSIRLPDLATSGWRVGQTIIIGGTECLPFASSDPDYRGPAAYYGYRSGRRSQIKMDEFQRGQEEQRVITNISGDVLSFTTPLQYDHVGAAGVFKDGTPTSIVPVVMNPCQSIRFRSASAAEDGDLDSDADLHDLQKRAHMMFMRHPDVDLRYFETRNMGRTDTNPTLFVANLPYSVEVMLYPLTSSSSGPAIANPNNVRGRYPIHLHWCGGSYKGAPQINLIGATAWAPVGSPPIPGWGITQHGTRAAIEKCGVFNVRGAGIVSELGMETGQWVENVVMYCRSDGEGAGWGTRAELFVNHNGHAGVAFENQSRAILLHGNVATSSKYGYLYLHQKGQRDTRGYRDIDVRLLDGAMMGTHAPHRTNWDEHYIGAHAVQIPPWPDNEAHGCTTGLSVIHRIGNESGPVDTPMLVERFKCLSVPFPFHIPEYSNSYFQKHCFFVGPLSMMGSTTAVRLGNVTWKWNFANCLFRNYNRAFSDSGAGLNYGGFFIDIKLENVNSFTNAPTYSGSGSKWDAVRAGGEGIMGDWEDVSPGVAIIRRWENLDSSDLPQKYPLAPFGRKLPSGHPAVNPGDTPYFVLGDGTNGAASTDPTTISLTLTAGSGRNQARWYGIIRDSVGDMRTPDWQTSETFPANTSVKGHRFFDKMQPEQVIQRWGCWNANGIWKTRVWFMSADRFTLKRYTYHIDFTLSGFSPEFLAVHDLGAPGPAPEWPDKLEAVPSTQRPLLPFAKTMRFLSRTRLEVVSGQALTHRLRPNEVATRLEIVGGADAGQFRISMQQLQWASGGTRTRNGADANGDNTYEVTVRVTDIWGNSHQENHRVLVVPSTRVSMLITDDFNRSDQNLTTNGAYVMLRGSSSSFGIRSNRLAPLISSTPHAVVDMGSLGTSEQELGIEFRASTNAMLLFRMADADNWLGVFRMDSGSYVGLHACVNGSVTEISRLQHIGSNNMQVFVRGRTIQIINDANVPAVMHPRPSSMGQLSPLELDPLSGPGVYLLPDNLPRGTHVGFRTGTSAPTGWAESFLARALPS